MSSYSDTKLPLKIVINKQKTKVLFAEANIDFINVLLSFLALPLGKLRYNLCGVRGSLDTLYSSLHYLDDFYFCVRGGKKMLTHPQTSLRAECRKLALVLTESPPNKFYVCEDCSYSKIGYMDVSMYSDIATCECGKSLNKDILVSEYSDGGAFITNPSSFIITDDLRVVPILTGIIQTLGNLGITDTQGAHFSSLSFGSREFFELLKFSLVSATPLTDMIMKKAAIPTDVKPELGILLDCIPKEKAHSRKMVLKVSLQKSTNIFLFAEATGEFVEMLFSFLTIPFGGVVSLFGGSNCLKSFDNLYRSVSNGIHDKCFATPDTKNRLINPKLPHGYVFQNQFLPLSVDSPPKLHYTFSKSKPTSFHEKNGTLVSSFKSSKEIFVKKHLVYIVSDDLTVSPGLSTGISILNCLGVPHSDVKETELPIGLEEGLRILKTFLTSKTVLTDALINPMLKTNYPN